MTSTPGRGRIRAAKETRGCARGEACRKVSRTFLQLPGERLSRVGGGGGASVQPRPRAPSGVRGASAAAAAPGRRAEPSGAPRAPGRASHLAQRSWAASAAASAGGESNTFSLNFAAPVPANTHSRTHTRARRASHRRADGRRRLSAASFPLPRSYWRGGYCFIYLFPPRVSVPPPPPPSLPLLRPLLLLLLLLPRPRGWRQRRSRCSVAGLRAR